MGKNVEFSHDGYGSGCSMDAPTLKFQCPYVLLCFLTVYGKHILEK